MSGVRGRYAEELFQTRALTLRACGRFSIADEQLKTGTTLLTVELKQRHADFSGRVVNELSHWRPQPNADQVRCLPWVDGEGWNADAQHYNRRIALGWYSLRFPPPRILEIILSDWLSLTKQR